MADSTPLLLRPKQAAKFSGIGRDRFYKLLKEGSIPAVEVDGLTMIPRARLERWIEGLPQAGGQ